MGTKSGEYKLFPEWEEGGGEGIKTKYLKKYTPGVHFP